MCGRASLTKQEKDLENQFGLPFYQEDIGRYNPLPSYNVAPTHYHPVLATADHSHLLFFRWGLVPAWSKDEKSGARMINARMETLHEKPAFNRLLASNRCIVPFDGFYEWKKIGFKSRLPLYITVDGSRVFCVAGLWDVWNSSEGILLHTFTLITTPPNDFMIPIHNRMPAILLQEHEKLWLSGDIPTKDLMELLMPYPSERMNAWAVDPRIGQVRYNDPGLIQPWSPPGDLFSSDAQL